MLRGVASLVPGRADAAGTAQYAQKVASRCGKGHLRILPTQAEADGDLTVLSLGPGTYLGPEADGAESEYVEVMPKALSVNINEEAFIEQAATTCSLRAHPRGRLKHWHRKPVLRGGYENWLK